MMMTCIVVDAKVILSKMLSSNTKTEAKELGTLVVGFKEELALH